MKIQYKINACMNGEAGHVKVFATDVIEVFKSSGINRPIADAGRIQLMLDNSNLIITAWDGVEMIGIARSVTDFNYCCYLSDLAVKKEYQKSGIGKALIQHTKDTIGDQTMLLLLSAAPAMEYYPKIGFEKVENGFIIKRKS
ncbi:MAG: GNAT family N-acetyltransferase [Bacteroidetes bacterium RIFCSPLOWO2_12_FULL_35_15]|nr:MAG: GNAT family N-acetyltransferase [Bacteroidetes bacterium RIFCSPLOWO2_12_FULL_35_15]